MKLWLFVMPSAAEGGWRRAVSEAAAAAQLPVWREDLVAMAEAHGEGLVVTADPRPALVGWTEAALVVPAQNGVEFLIDLGFTHADAVRRVAEFLAFASDVKARGGVLLDGSAPIVEVEGIGRVSRSGSSIAVNFHDGPLDIFRYIPPEIGSAAKWDAELFAFASYGKELNLLASPSIDVTGGARTLVLGPQITLSPGRWRVCARIMVDPEGSTTYLQASWGFGSDRVDVTAELNVPGEYSLVLEHDWRKSAEAELMIVSVRPHFCGRLEFMNVAVDRVG
ncbi:hypothetical protein D3C86_1084020 [compost metagenome]